MQNTLTILALKKGNIKHYKWNVTILEKHDNYIITKGEIERDLKHYTKGKTFTFHKPSLEIFFFKKWYTISANIKDEQIDSYYCNIAKPAKLIDDTLTFVDLDLDLIKNVAEEWKVVDEDEFKENSLKYSYTPQLIKQTKSELRNLQTLISKKGFPFDGSLNNYIKKYIKK